MELHEIPVSISCGQFVGLSSGVARFEEMPAFVRLSEKASFAAHISGSLTCRLLPGPGAGC